MAKRKGALFLFICIFILFSLNSASADSLSVNDLITLKDGPGTTGGGEFKIYKDGAYQFNTFCVEKYEFINFTDEFKIVGISDFAVNGGDPSSGGDELSAYTKYLFYHFTVKDLAGYDYSDLSQRTQDANMLQMAIWYFEDELGSTVINNKFTQLAYQKIDVEGVGPGGQVKVLNLVYAGSKTEAQDQLVVVPEPGALIGLGIVLLSLGGIATRRFKR